MRKYKNNKDRRLVIEKLRERYYLEELREKIAKMDAKEESRRGE